MKAVSEYNINDWTEIKSQALKIAMASIHDVFCDVKDDSEIGTDEIQRVKKAVETIHICTDIKL